MTLLSAGSAPSGTTLVWVGGALVLAALLALALWWFRRRAAGAPPRGDIGRALDEIWGPVERSLSATERQLGTTVVALDDAVWERSTALERLAGAAASPTGAAPLRVHRGRGVVVLRLRDELLIGEDPDVDRALAKLAGELSGVVLFVLGVDFAELHAGHEARLRAWAAALARKLPLFQSAGRSLGVRICVTGLEDEAGYGPSRELWSRGARAPWPLSVVERTEGARQVLGDAEERVGQLLGIEPARFEPTVRLLGALPERLRGLAAFTGPLADALRRFTRGELNGVFLTDAQGQALPRHPFALAPEALTEARVGLRRAAWRRTAQLCGVACGLLALCFVGHGIWLGRVGARLAEYQLEVERSLDRGLGVPLDGADDASTWGAGASAVSSASSPGGARVQVSAAEAEQAPEGADAGAPSSAASASSTASSSTPSSAASSTLSSLQPLGVRAAAAGAGVRSLRFWALPFAGRAGRDEARRAFVDATRQAYVTPYLDSRTSFARRVFAAVLDRATTTNDLGELVLAHPTSWATLLGMPERTVEDFVRVRSDIPPARLTLRDLDAAARSVAEWRKLVLDVSAAVQEGVFSPDVLERARQNPLLRELPANAAELRLLQRAVDLVSRELVRPGAGTEQGPALREELHFLEQNLTDLVTLRAWLDGAPRLEEVRAPETLARLLDRIAPRPNEPGSAAQDPAGAPEIAPLQGAGRVLEIRFGDRVERITEREFRRASTRTAGRAAYHAFLAERCGASRGRSDVLQQCPYLRAGYDGTLFFPLLTRSGANPVDAYAVRGPVRGSFGPATALPGMYTREAFTKYVAPALSGLTERLEGAELSAADHDDLLAWIGGHLDAYAERYFEALRSYLLSVRFAPVNLAATKAALTELAAPGSWFTELVGTVARHADLPLEGVQAPGLESALRPFAGLVEVTQSKGLEQYGKLLLALLAEAEGAEAAASDGRAGGKQLAEALGVLTALQQGANLDVGRWLDGEQIVGEWRRPFELPVNALRSQALLELERSWQREIVRPAAALLRRYPFSSAASPDLSTSVEEVAQEFAPKGRLWTTVEDLLASVVVSSRGRTVHQRRRWSMRPGLPEPEGLLDYLNAAERLTTLFWLDDGEQRPLAVALTPLELPSGTIGEPLLALAYLSLAGVGMHSFNQVSDETILEVPWWSREPSTLSVEVLDEHASEVKAYYEAASMPGPWSFLKLLDSGCAPRRGDTVCTELAWPVKKLPGHPLVKFELAGDVSDVFRELARLAERKEVP